MLNSRISLKEETKSPKEWVSIIRIPSKLFLEILQSKIVNVVIIIIRSPSLTWMLLINHTEVVGSIKGVSVMEMIKSSNLKPIRPILDLNLKWLWKRIKGNSKWVIRKNVVDKERLRMWWSRRRTTHRKLLLYLILIASLLHQEVMQSCRTSFIKWWLNRSSKEMGLIY